MFVIISGRRGGKTSVVARWLAEDPEYRAVLVASEARRKNFLDHIAHLSPPDVPMSFWRDRIVPVNYAVTARSLPPWMRQVAIDDLNDVLAALLGDRVGVIDLVTTTATPIILPVERGPYKHEFLGEWADVQGREDANAE